MQTQTVSSPAVNAGASRLPAPRRSPLDWSPLGGLVMRPWYDRCALHLIGRWYLPLSRAWAAALTHGEDEAGFARAIGLAEFPAGASGRKLRRAIAETARRAAVLDQADAQWRDAFFGQKAPPDRELVQAEQARLAAASSLMAARAGFLGVRQRSPAVGWQVTPPAELPTPDEWRASAGTCIAAPGGAEGRLPAVAVSHPVPGPGGRERWLRFAAPGLPGDTVWARVFEPEGIDDAPTLINLHGIGMELEYWRDAVDNTPDLTRQGIRVIRPEGPWHGRRRPAGCYGGEPVMALGPEGFLKLFSAWGAEAGVITAWARQAGSRRVAVGGVSLGALTSQLTAVAAADWPEEMRPDALILVATSGDLLGVAEGSLAGGVGFWPAIARAGWTPADLEGYLPLMVPQGPAAMPPERIVMALGAADTVTPFAGGQGLARRWAVPPENLFIRPQGHFSVSLDLVRQPQPLDRIIEILKQG